MSSERQVINPSTCKTALPGKRSSALLFCRDLRRTKGVSDGQQVDILVLEYIVMEGRSRLTKPDDWKCLAKQCDMSQMLIFITLLEL